MDHQNKGVDVDESELKKLMSKPLIKVRVRLLLSFQKGWSCLFFKFLFWSTRRFIQYSDMPTEMGAETVEIITMAVDKFQSTKNYEVNDLMLVLVNLIIVS